MDKIVIGNNGGTMSPKKWNELMLHLEEKGFSWRNQSLLSYNETFLIHSRITLYEIKKRSNFFKHGYIS